jgi:hypothetical protein
MSNLTFLAHADLRHIDGDISLPRIIEDVPKGNENEMFVSNA